MSIIYLVEDDAIQAEYVLQLLLESPLSLEVRHIATELEFRERFEELAQSRPAGVILDVLIQFASNQVTEIPDSPGPFVTAGLRCHNKLVSDPRTREVPVIFYTVLDKSDIPGFPRGVEYIRKDASDRRFLSLVQHALGVAD